MHQLVGDDVEAITLSFARKETEWDERYSFVFNVVDDDAIQHIQDALNEVVRAKGVRYPKLDYPPVRKAGEVDGAREGVVVYADYKIGNGEPSPFTTDGKDFCNPVEVQIVEGLMRERGRNARVQLEFFGQAPRDGNESRKALPFGNVYCNVKWLVPLGDVTPIGNALEGRNVNVKGAADLKAEADKHKPSVPVQDASNGGNGNGEDDAVEEVDLLS